jgi:DNA repair exonuclease SbcCD ATPase subunit
MLKIKNVTAKNFMSIGAQTQAVNFDNCNLTLVLGHNLDMGGDGSRNGTGKTTIINALSYALYGEALTNIRKDNLINKTNGKNMFVTVDFDIAGKEYRIERGRKPNVLRLIVDGSDNGEASNEDDDAQGDSRETQKAIEKIVGFPHEMFKHIIALNTYTEPFLAMKANDQRNMIEQLLGITELSEKADLLKEILKNTKDSIKEEEIRIAAVKSSNERIEKNISDIELRGKAWGKTKSDKLADMATTISTLSEINIEQEIANHKHNQTVKELNDTKAVLIKEKDRSDTSFNRSVKKLDELKANLQKAQEGMCPACGQGTAHLSTHEEYTRELVDKIAEEQKYHDDIEIRINELILALSEYADIADETDTYYNDLESALEHKHNLDTLASQYAEKLEETNPYIEQVEQLRKTGLEDITWDYINDLTDRKEHQEFLHKLLTSKDSFIRKRIIDQNISYLNHRLAYYLDKIGLPHDVKFNSDLSVEITEYGRDLDFDNLSRGERNRLILSLSWAFRDIYESLNRPMNLMCIDELIDSGMDTMGVENSLAILKKMNREQHKNIFLISHKEELVGRVNNVLTVIKEGGFTSYNTDTEYVN